ncbi:glycosyltransferase family 4 protein [Pseudocolwellia sp. HL-MZ7]|uniref:glycosyltransferase family 4 protein n=1 Tax=Pseudocolwellia sp. HL-MZ7 TaxID=3400627 RepID=UPI003CE7FB6C
MSRNKKLLFWGELPPDVYHGISLSNELILSTLSEEFDLYKVKDNASFKSTPLKLFSLFISILKLIYFSFKKPNIYYLNLPMSYLGLRKTIFSIYLIRFISPKTKVITHLHRGDYLEFIKEKKHKELLKKAFKHITAIIVLSEISSTELIQSGLIHKDKIIVIHNSVKILTPKESIDVYRQVNDDAPYLYCLCNYIPSKRIHSLVRIVNNSNFIKVKFNGAKSSDEYMDELLNIDRKTICDFGGVIENQNKEKKLNSAYALVLPSLNEGMPLVILESLAQGTPVICFNVGFISDYLGINYPGLVKELSDDALKEKIKWLQNLTYDEYHKLRKTSFNIFWEQYSQKKLKRIILDRFEKI